MELQKFNVSTTPEAVVGDVYNIVDSRLNYLDELSKTFLSQLNSAMGDIKDIHLQRPAQIPALETPAFERPAFNNGNIPVVNFSPIANTPFPDEPDLSLLSQIDSIDEIDIPPPPEVMAISLPSEPALVSVSMPSKPKIDTTITLPTEPTVVLPDVPELEKLNLPDFDYQKLLEFEDKFDDSTAPTLNDIHLPSDRNIEWNSGNEKYQSPLADRLEQYFMGFMGSSDREFGQEGDGVTVGTTGLPAVVEKALFDRANERQADETRKAIDEARTEWASRGFSMPQGMLAKTIEGIKYEDMKRSADLNRDIFTEAAKIRIEQLKFVVEKGLALEEQKRRTFAEMLNRLFEVAKYQADAEMRVFNAQISLFNTRQEAYKLQFDIYKAKIEQGTAKLQAYRTAIDAQVALGQLNNQYLEIYKTKVQAMMSHIEVYKAKLQAVSVKSDVIKSQFDGYRTEIQAYSEQMNVNKNLVELYDSRIKAEVAKGSLSEVQAKNYAALVQGLSSKADLKMKDGQMKIEQVKAGLSAFNAKIDLSRAIVQSNISQSQQETARYQAEVEAWKAGKGVETAQLETKSRYADMVSRTNIAYSQMQISKYQADMSAAKEEAMIALEQAKSVGTFSAQLAAGAMSAAHISASLSGSGSLSSSKSTSESESHSYSY